MSVVVNGHRQYIVYCHFPHDAVGNFAVVHHSSQAITLALINIAANQVHVRYCYSCSVSVVVNGHRRYIVYCHFPHDAVGNFAVVHHSSQAITLALINVAANRVHVRYCYSCSMSVVVNGHRQYIVYCHFPHDAVANFGVVHHSP